MEFLVCPQDYTTLIHDSINDISNGICMYLCVVINRHKYTNCYRCVVIETFTDDIEEEYYAITYYDNNIVNVCRRATKGSLFGMKEVLLKNMWLRIEQRVAGLAEVLV